MRNLVASLLLSGAVMPAWADAYPYALEDPAPEDRVNYDLGPAEAAPAPAEATPVAGTADPAIAAPAAQPAPAEAPVTAQATGTAPAEAPSVEAPPPEATAPAANAPVSETPVTEAPPVEAPLAEAPAEAAPATPDTATAEPQEPDGAATVAQPEVAAMDDPRKPVDDAAAAPAPVAMTPDGTPAPTESWQPPLATGIALTGDPSS